MNNIEVGASFSVGRVTYKHVFRITMTPNVDPNLTKDNIILADELQGQPVEAYADKEMQPHIDEYNAKQKRKDRRINKTFSEYFYGLKDHCDLCYEAVCQFGNHEDLGGEYYAVGTSDARKKEIKKEYSEVYQHMLKVFKEKYPHLKVLYAVIHFDEPNGTPHMHICYMPIGEGFKQGLSHQVSIGKALENDGIERVTSRLEAKMLGGYQISKFYREIRQKYFNKELERRGYTIKEEEHGRTHDDSSLVREAYTDIQQRETVLELKEEQFEQKQEEYASMPVPEVKTHEEEISVGFMKKEGVTVVDNKSAIKDLQEQNRALKAALSKEQKVTLEQREEIRGLHNIFETMERIIEHLLVNPNFNISLLKETVQDLPLFKTLWKKADQKKRLLPEHKLDFEKPEIEISVEQDIER